MNGMSTATLAPPSPDDTLTDLRSRAGLTTRQAGERMGLTHARIVQIEDTGSDSIDQLEALAAIYDVTEDEIRAANKRTKSR